MCLDILNWMWDFLLFFKENKRRNTQLFMISLLALSQPTWYRPKSIINEDPELNIL